MWKHILILALILTSIGGYVFWTSHRKHSTKTLGPPAGAAAEQRGTPLPETDTVPRENTENDTQQRFHGTFSEFFPVESATDPEVQKLLEIFDSPEFAAFAEAGDYSSDAFYGFLASQGIPWDRVAYYRDIQEKFQKHYPGETPESIEPQIRQSLIGLFAENEGSFDMNTFVEVMITFLEDEKQRSWISARFPGREADFGNWVAGVMKDYIQPPGTDTSPIVETETPLSRPEDLPADERLFDDPSTETTETPPVQTTTPSALDKIEVLSEGDSGRDVDIQTEIQKLLESTLPEIPKTPTLVDIEKYLRDRFSPQQYNTALQTLNRYGPEEGLRRLQKSAPELATQLERFFQGNEKEND